MRRYCSVLGLAARCTFWKVLAATMVSCGAEAALFLTTLARWGPERNPMSLEGLLFHSRVFLCFGPGLVLVCALLALWEGTGSGSQTGYTVRRLRVGEVRLSLLWAGYGLACLVFYWGCHLGTVLALCAAALPRLAPEAASPLALFLACWRAPYLHALLPLTDLPLLVRNLLLLAGLGLNTANCAHQSRHGRRAWAWMPLSVAGALFFPMPMAAAEWFGNALAGGPFGPGVGEAERLQSLSLAVASLVLSFWSVSCIRKGEPNED